MDPFSNLPTNYYQMSVMAYQAFRPPPTQPLPQPAPSPPVACRPLQTCCAAGACATTHQPFTLPFSTTSQTNCNSNACASSQSSSNNESKVASTCSLSSSERDAANDDTCSQTTSERSRVDDDTCSLTSSDETRSLASKSVAESYASSWSSEGDAVPFGATAQVLEALATGGSDVFKKLFDETIIEGCDNDIPIRTVNALYKFNQMIHSRFDFHSTLKSMLESTIIMYQSSERQRLKDKYNFDNLVSVSSGRIVELEEYQRQTQSKNSVETDKTFLYTTEATVSLGLVGQRVMIYKAGEICPVMPVWVMSKELPIPRKYLDAARKRGIVSVYTECD